MPPPISSANIGWRRTSDRIRRKSRRSGVGSSLNPSSLRRAAACAAPGPFLQDRRHALPVARDICVLLVEHAEQKARQPPALGIDRDAVIDPVLFAKALE